MPWILGLALAAPLDPFAFVSLGDLDPSGPLTVDTDALTMTGGGVNEVGVLDGGRAVFVFDEVVLDEPVTVVGGRPLVVLSRGDFVLADTLEIDGADARAGAGGYGGGTAGAGFGPGGGASAVTGAGGGFGGVGGAPYGLVGGATYGDLLLTLEGGSGGGAGQDGLYLGFFAAGGGGGGAVELGAADRLVIGSGGVIEADGGNGVDTPVLFGLGAGGAGGAGGGVLLHAAEGVCQGEIDVSGGEPGSGLFGSGGGGGGRVVVLGLNLAPCDVRLGGGGGYDPGADGTLLELEPLADDDGDGYTTLDDCDDGDPSVNPAAAEIGCNGVDDDCSAATVDAADADGDGVSVCAGDCDDGDAGAYPGAVEVLCDGVDQDCDGVTGDDVDADGDGVGRCDGDCDDGDAGVYPGAAELLCDGVDQDCDGVIGDDVDADGDGVGGCDGDCDDGDAGVYPGAVEQLCDGVDQDCDAATADGVDADGDGVDGCDDCDDGDPSVYPGADDAPGDGIDQDCDGSDAAAGDDDDDAPGNDDDAAGDDDDAPGDDDDAPGDGDGPVDDAAVEGVKAGGCRCSSVGVGGGAWLMLPTWWALTRRRARS